MQDGGDYGDDYGDYGGDYGDDYGDYGSSSGFKRMYRCCPMSYFNKVQYYFLIPLRRIQ